MPRAPEELRRLLVEQLDFMAVSAAAFDDGRVHEAKRLATSCRVLFLDGQPPKHPNARQSISLLTQMDLREQLWLADNAPQNRDAQQFSMGLWRLRFDGQSGGQNVANLDPPMAFTRFEAWWSKQPVERHAPGVEIYRRDVIRWLANKDGGAHVDPELEEPYSSISQPGYAWIESTGRQGDSMIPYMMRGIAHEVLVTLTEPR